ncbi:unnamed protein product [Agarophyton chilense]
MPLCFLALIPTLPSVRPRPNRRHPSSGPFLPTCQTSTPPYKTSRKPSRIKVFDTTLRDGELNPAVSFTLEDKVAIAYQLYLLGVDVIEAGFPALYPSDTQALLQISKQIGNLPCPPHICALCRANERDIQLAFESIQHALHPRIHTFLTTSTSRPTLHKQHRNGEKLLHSTENAVRFAKSLCADVEFSAAGAFQTDRQLLLDVIECAIQSGATTINIPDTDGTCLPSQVSSLFKFIGQKANHVNSITLSFHAHNDLGLAVANSLCAIQNGSRQVEVSVNGIGARKGNASLEDIVMALFDRKKAFYDALCREGDEFVGKLTNIEPAELWETSRLVAERSGMIEQRNKDTGSVNATFIHPNRT